MYYDLSYYTNILKSADLLIKEARFNTEHQKVLHLEQNSKKVEPGTLFICKGAHFKVDYLKEAIKRGAIAYVSEEEYDLEDDIPHFIVSDIRRAISLLAEVIYHHPQEKLKIVGVGGTKRKTTTKKTIPRRARMTLCCRPQHTRSITTLAASIRQCGARRRMASPDLCLAGRP